jgi:hypothetical protein
MISMQPIINNINNAILSSVHAMPAKDGSADGTDSFAIARHEYVNIQTQKIPLRTELKPAYFGMSGFMGRSRVLPTVFDGTHSIEQKKWIGGNRDASAVSTRNRVNAVGNGTLNSANQPTSFMSKTDINVQRNAIHRTRSGGSIAPAKKTHNYSGAPIFY